MKNFDIETIGKLEIKKGYVFNIARHEIVTNMTKYNKRDVLTILKKLSTSKILKYSVEELKDEYIFNGLYENLKTRGFLQNDTKIKFQKITELANDRKVYHYDINCSSFGGGGLIKDIKIILVK